MNHNLLHYILTVCWYLIKSGGQGIVAIVVTLFGISLFNEIEGPWKILIALPIAIGAGGIALNKFFSLYLSITSKKFNKGVCVICSKKLY